MPKAFLSYAHEDEPIAKRLAADLKSRGVEVLSLDTVAMPGQGWAAKLSEAIEASDAFIVLVSRASEKSQWVNQETALALSWAQEGPLRVFPVFVDKDVEPPFFLRHVRAVDYTKPDSAQSELDTLVSAFQAERSPLSGEQELAARLEQLRSHQAALQEEILAQASRRAAWTSAIAASITILAAAVTLGSTAAALSWPSWIDLNWVWSFGAGVTATLLAVSGWSWIRQRIADKPDSRGGSR